MLSDFISEVKPKMEERMVHFLDGIKTIRVGKAESSLVEDIVVTFYGTSLPLKQMASVSTPSPNLIVVKPWDNNALGDIELAIRNSNLSINPTNDGVVVRISLPPLSEERRKELCKLIHDKGEETRISLRNTRHDCWQKIVKAEREHQLSEDDRYRGEEELNKMIEQYNKRIDDAVKQKESDIMRV